MFPSWTLLPFKQSTYCSFPPGHRTKLTLKLSSCIPSSIEMIKCFLTFFFCLILDINVSSQVWFEIATDLELNDFSHTLKFRNSIIVELQKLVIDFILAVLQSRICVIVIPPALLHSKCNKHTSDEEGWAGSWMGVLTRAPVSKSACSSFKIERTICSVFFCSKVMWRFWIMPSATIF